MSHRRTATGLLCAGTDCDDAFMTRRTRFAKEVLNCEKTDNLQDLTIARHVSCTHQRILTM